MTRCAAILTAAVLTVVAAPGAVPAADLGVRGQTWPVSEPDLLEEIEARLSDMQRSGELARLETEARARARARLEAPEAVAGIAPARERRSRLFDPAIVVERDIRSPDGTLIAAAGTRLDPLAGMTLARDLLFIDGTARRGSRLGAGARAAREDRAAGRAAPRPRAPCRRTSCLLRPGRPACGAARA